MPKSLLSSFNKLLYYLLPTTLFCSILIPFSFSKRPFPAFLGLDGLYQLTNNMQAQDQRFPIGYFTSNPLQGLGGNIPFLYNYRLDPGYYFISKFAEVGISYAVAFWLSMLSCSLIFLCKALQKTSSSSLLISTCVPIMIFGSFSYTFSFVPLLTPHLIFSISIATAILACIIELSNSIHLWRYTLTAVSLTVLFILLNPSFFVLAVPFFFIASSIFIPKERFIDAFLVLPKRIRIFFLLLMLSSIIFVFVYLAGLFLYSAAFTERDFLAPNERIFKHASSLLNLDRLPSVAIFLIALLSTFVNLKSPNTVIRNQNKLMAYSSFFLFFYAALWLLSDEIRKGIRPLYFEFFAWPIILVNFFSAISLLLHKFKLWKSSILRNSLSLLVCSALLINFGQFVFSSTNSREYLDGKQTNRFPLTFLQLRFLESTSFGGRVLILDSLNSVKELSNASFHSFEGIEFEELSFWSQSIPTVTEYSQFITPRSYSLISRFFSHTDMKNTRNLVLTNSFDYRGLELLGVSRIISNTKLRDARLNLIHKYENSVNSVYVYRPIQVDLIPFSPATLIVKNNLHAALSQVLEESFNPRNEVVVRNSSLADLKVASDISFKYREIGYELSANSEGTSLIVLPIEYSSCFELSDSKAATVEVNAGMLGVVFNQHLDSRLVYKNGLFRNPWCRMVDLFSYKNFE